MNLIFVDLFSVFFWFYNLGGLVYMKAAHWIRFGDEYNEVHISIEQFSFPFQNQKS